MKNTPTKLFKISKAIIKNVDEKNFTVDALVSTDAVDRDGEIILKTAWNNGGLKDYISHPVLLSSHNYTDLTKQIGKSLNTEVTQDGLVCQFQYFVGEGNPEADWAFKLASKGIAAYSVGFMGLDWNEGDYSAGIGRIFTAVSLLEVSQVLIPCNPEALQRSYKDPLEKELVEMATKAFSWKGAKKDLKVTKAAIKSFTKDCVTIEITIEDENGQSTSQDVPVPVQDGIATPPNGGANPGPGLPTLYTLSEVEACCMNASRAALKEYHPDCMKGVNDLLSQYLVPAGKHYSRLLFEKDQKPTGILNPSEVKAAFEKTIEEGFK